MVVEPAIELDGVERCYGDRRVLDGASLRIGRGELVALTGRSGSGKSTLLHIVAGLDRGYRGNARVLGRDLGGLDERGLAALRGGEVGLVFQAFHLLDHLDCLENVALPGLLRPTRASLRARAGEALDRVGMGDYRAALPSVLSGGQKQRVAIARALFHRPSLLLADEPTGNLDADTGRDIVELFRSLVRDGTTLFVVTHEERMSSAAGRVLRLERGRIAEAA